MLKGIFSINDEISGQNINVVNEYDEKKDRTYIFFSNGLVAEFSGEITNPLEVKEIYMAETFSYMKKCMEEYKEEINTIGTNKKSKINIKEDI